MVYQTPCSAHGYVYESLCLHSVWTPNIVTGVIVFHVHNKSWFHVSIGIRSRIFSSRVQGCALSYKSNERADSLPCCCGRAFVQMDAKLGWAPRPGEEEEEGSLQSLHDTQSSLRSSQSQMSKQSFRSLKSGGRQSTGDRSANGRGRFAQRYSCSIDFLLKSMTILGVRCVESGMG